MSKNLFWKRMRRILILCLGSIILIFGVIMIVLPGPASFFIPAGLAILATELSWADTLFKKFKKKVKSLQRTAS